MPSCFAPLALLPDGWAHNVLLTFDDAGLLVAVEPNATVADAPRTAGPVVPGMPNLHCHAFQRAMVGLTGAFSIGGDSFWTWRKAMYHFAEALTPDDLEAITAGLYLDLLRHGYTSVGEFHYLHHASDGSPYADRAELAHRIVQAATATQIRLTLLPVLYTYSDFGGEAPLPEQRRFINTVDQLFTIILSLRRAYPNLRLGLAPHSLRAVVPGQLEEAATLLRLIDDTAPMHMHVAEQEREVEGCLAWSGQRPVEWLLDHAPVSSRWCLIHATHLTPKERSRLTETKAVVGLCPSTEADLGDGLFALPDFVAEGGRFGIGSDSNVRVSPADELRLAEYGQRLHHRRRNVVRRDRSHTIGYGLYTMALQGGAQALGQPLGQLAPGHTADFVVLRGDHPQLAGKTEDQVLDTWLTVGGTEMVRDVFVGGKHVIADGHHAEEVSIAKRYRDVMQQMVST